MREQGEQRIHVGCGDLAKRRQVAMQKWHSVCPSVDHRVFDISRDWILADVLLTAIARAPLVFLGWMAPYSRVPYHRDCPSGRPLGSLASHGLSCNIGWPSKLLIQFHGIVLEPQSQSRTAIRSRSEQCGLRTLIV